jgi:hypothetical protein
MPTNTLEINNRVRVNIGGVSYWRKPEQVESRRPARIGPMRMFMGEVIREERLAQGRSLRDISGSGVSLGFISEVERGMKEPSSETLETICKSLGMDVVDALRRTADRIEFSRSEG